VQSPRNWIWPSVTKEWQIEHLNPSSSSVLLGIDAPAWSVLVARHVVASAHQYGRRKGRAVEIAVEAPCRPALPVNADLMCFLAAGAMEGD
jgi:hypothetical protein